MAARDISVKHVMNVHQAAAYMGVGTDTVYSYAKDGVIPAFKLGNRWRFKKSKLDAWMDEQHEEQKVQRGK